MKNVWHMSHKLFRVYALSRLNRDIVKLNFLMLEDAIDHDDYLQ